MNYGIRLAAPLITFSTLLIPQHTLSEEAYFRLRPSEQILSSSSPGEKAEKIYVDIRANPGSWRENETIHFPVSLSPSINANISATGLPGTITYNEGLRAFTGNTSAGNPPYRNTFRIHASSIGFSESKEFDLYVYPELQVSTESHYIGRVGRSFNESILSSGIVGTPSWSSNVEIPGLNIVNGNISGVPNQEGTYSGIIINVIDGIDNKVAQTTPFTIEIEPSDYTKVLSPGVEVSLRSLFSDTEWNSDIPKVAILPENSVIGSNNPSIPALSTGHGWNGSLTLRIEGEVQGAGGIANGGVGGTAIRVEDSRLQIQNYGAIKAGGGGGGQGGRGGSHTSLNYDYEHRGSSFGAYNNHIAMQWNGSYYQAWEVYWGGQRIGYANGYFGQGGPGPVVIGGYRYSFSNIRHYSYNGRWDVFEVYRELVNPITVVVEGGKPGDGGRGQGYNGALATGSNGSLGPANTGMGGTGGTGGDWGQSGSSGEPGTLGSPNAGEAGNHGGLSGVAIEGSAAITGTGEILGR